MAESTVKLSEKLTSRYTVLADFLRGNRLKVNDDKTHLLVMSTRQKRRFRDTSTVAITTPTAVIGPSSVERLLGAQVHQDLHWGEHIMYNKEALIKSLNRRVGALRKLSIRASFKTRKMIANRIFMSKLIYLVPVWMGCEEYLADALQVCQNKAARTVTRLNRFTPTSVLLLQCGWLNVRQLMLYHSLVLLHKTITHKKPDYLHKKITSGSYQPRTRQATAAAATLAAAGAPDPPSISWCTLQVTRKSWCWASVYWYYRLPLNLRMETKLETFKIAAVNKLN